MYVHTLLKDQLLLVTPYHSLSETWGIWNNYYAFCAVLREICDFTGADKQINIRTKFLQNFHFGAQKTCAHSSVITVQQQSVQGQNKGTIQFNDPLTVQKVSFQFHFKDF